MLVIPMSSPNMTSMFGLLFCANKLAAAISVKVSKVSVFFIFASIPRWYVSQGPNTRRALRRCVVPQPAPNRGLCGNEAWKTTRPWASRRQRTGRILVRKLRGTEERAADERGRFNVRDVGIVTEELDATAA